MKEAKEKHPIVQSGELTFEWSENTKKEKEEILSKDPLTKLLKAKLSLVTRHHIDYEELKRRIDFVRKVGVDKFLHFLRQHYGSSFHEDFFSGGLSEEAYKALCEIDLSKEQFLQFLKLKSFKKFTLSAPYVDLIPFRMVSSEPLEKTYIPEGCKRCSKAKESGVIGYILATPISFLRIEGCIGSETCLERTVQLLVKGMVMDSKFFTLRDGKVVRASLEENSIFQVFTMAWKVLLGEIGLDVVSEYFKKALFFYEDEELFSQIKGIPSSAMLEHLSVAFIEEKIPGFLVYPVVPGAVCGFGNEAPKKARFYYDLFSDVDKDLTRHNFILSVTRNGSVGYNFVSCLSSNCYCQVMGNVFEEIKVNRVGDKLSNPGVIYLGLLFSPELVKQHVIAFNQEDVDKGLRNMLNFLKLMVLTQG
ncbi:MAG: hypothetical protein QXX12_02920 [Nanopusillaceae archaeon]